MSEIRAVLFDLDGTLYVRDEEIEDWANGIISTAFSDEQAALFDAVLPSIVADLQVVASTSDVELVLNHLETLCPGMPYEAGELLVRMNREWYADMRLTPQAVCVLAELDARRIPYGIVTNAPALQQIKIDRLGLNVRAACTFVSDIFGVQKPDPAIFRAAASAIGCNCASILFVGDSAEADIVGAHAVGMQTAWLHRGSEWPGSCLPVTPDYVMESLEEVIDIVSSK
jgi:HAD superfamily hydrolase (TIGR01509 family)